VTEFAPTFDEINAKAEEAVRAHEQAFGYKPSPGLLLNVLKAPIQPADYPALFQGAAGSRRSRRAQQTNTSVLGPNYKAGPAPIPEDLQAFAETGGPVGGTLVDPAQAEAAANLVGGPTGGLQQVTLPGTNRKGFVDPTLPEDLKRFAVTGGPMSGLEDKKLSLARAMEDDRIRALEEEIRLEDIRQGGTDWAGREYALDNLENLKRDGFQDSRDLQAATFGWAPPTDLFTRAMNQISEALVGMPFGVYELGKDVGFDLRDVTSELVRRSLEGVGVEDAIRVRDITPTRTKDDLVAMAKSTIEDFRHPGDNIGYLLLDVYGAATTGAAIVVKAGQISKLSTLEGVTRGAKIRAGVKIATSRYRPEPFEFGIEGATDFKFLSENAITALVQRAFYSSQSRRLEGSKVARRLYPDVESWAPTGLFADLRNRWLSPTASQRRARMNTLRMQAAVQLATTKEFERMVQARGRANGVLREVVARRSLRPLWGGIDDATKIGIDRAILIRSIDAPDDATAIRWIRENHERAIGELSKKIKRREKRLLDEDATLTDTAKKRIQREIDEFQYLVQRNGSQLDALSLGQAVLAHPPSGLDELIDLARQSSREQEKLRKLHLGLDEDRANQHIADIRMAWTGELKELRRLVGQGKAKGRIATLETVIARRESREAQIIAAGGDPNIPRAGNKVIAPDRGNIGTVTKIEDGVATVRFVEPKTKKVAKVEFNVDELKVAREPIEELKARLDAMRARADELAQKRRTVIDPERAFYLTYENDLLTTPKRGSGFGRRPGRFGTPPPAELSSLKHQFDGDTIIWGTYAYDTSRVIADQAKITVKTVALKYEHDQLVALAKARKNPHSPAGLPRPVAIRPDWGDVPPELRRQTTWLEGDKQGVLTRKDVEKLDEQGLAALRKDIVRRPDEIDGNQGDWLWIDESQLNTGAWTANGEDFLKGVDKALATMMTVPNEFGRIAYLFGRLAYGLNFLGAASIEMIHQGPWHFRNFATAVRAEDIWNRQTRALLDELSETGRTVSMQTEVNPLTMVSRKLAEIWAPLTDQFNRRSSIIYELRKEKGADGLPLLSVKYTGEEQYARLADPANRKAINRATAYARRHSVNFSNLSPLETAVFRHLFFVYAWASRSAIWSLNFIDTHPVLAAALAQAGKEREAVWEEMMGDTAAIDYLFKHGYIPVGDQAVFDPIQLSTPASITQFATGWWNSFSGGDLDTVRDQLGPGAALVADVFFGPENPFDKKGVKAAVTRAVTDTPAARAFGVGQEPDVTVEDLPAIEPTGGYLDAARRAMAPLRPALKMRVLKKNDFLVGPASPLIFGTASIRRTDELAAQARVWRDWQKQDPERIVNLITERLNLLLDEQAKIIGKGVPASVRDSVRLNALYELKYRQAAAERPEGTNPSTIDTVRLILDVLREDERITDEEEKQLWEKALDLTDNPGNELEEFKTALMWEHGGEPFRAWNERATVISRTSTAVAVVANQPGLDPNDVDTASEDDRLEWARQYAGYLDREQAALALEDRGDRSSAQLLLAEEGSKPVMVNGRRFPSFEEYRYFSLAEGDRQKVLLSLTRQEWDGLTSFEKRIVTDDPAKATDFAKAWTEYNGALGEGRNILEQMRARGEDTMRLDPSVAAKQLEEDYPGFQAEWDYAVEPRYVRFQDTVVYKGSDYRGEWDSLFLKPAADFQKAIDTIRTDPASYNETVGFYKANWNQSVMKMLEEMATDPSYAGMLQEVKALGGETFLKGLIK